LALEVHGVILTATGDWTRTSAITVSGEAPLGGFDFGLLQNTQLAVFAHVETNRIYLSGHHAETVACGSGFSQAIKDNFNRINGGQEWYYQDE
jgi:hypothetical protein